MLTLYADAAQIRRAGEARSESGATSNESDRRTPAVRYAGIPCREGTFAEGFAPIMQQRSMCPLRKVGAGC